MPQNEQETERSSDNEDGSDDDDDDQDSRDSTKHQPIATAQMMSQAEEWRKHFKDKLVKRKYNYANNEVLKQRSTAPGAGPNPEYWKNLKTYTDKKRASQEPTMEEIEDPLWLWFHIYPITIWIEAAAQTDIYAQQVMNKVRMESMQAGKEVQPRPWTPIGGDWDRLIRFIGIFTYVSAVRPGQTDFKVPLLCENVRML